MRYYVTASPRTWWAIAPQVPGAGAEDVASRDEALARCRERALEEAAAFTRLGYPIQVDASDEVIDWSMPWWLIPDSLLPTPRDLVGAAVARMNELAAGVDRFLDTLSADAWDRDPGDGWTIRRTLDHVAGGFGIGLRRLEPWPLDPDRAQADAAAELVSRIEGAPLSTVEQVGPNQHPARVRWTPRKVVRIVRSLQDAWAKHLDDKGIEPSLPFPQHDADDDGMPVAACALDDVLVADANLRRDAGRNPRVRAIAFWYRYYRDRLAPWPIDERERWGAMRVSFQRRLLALDERDLALVRIGPNGQCDTVRMQLGLGLSHVREHLDQMRGLVES